MAQFCINIADADVNRVITAMCHNYGYQSQVPNPASNSESVPNPESSFQFANRMTRDYLMNNTIAYELKKEKAAVPQPTPPDITDTQ